MTTSLLVKQHAEPQLAPSHSPVTGTPHLTTWVFAIVVLAGLLLLDVFGGVAYAFVVAMLTALAFFAFPKIRVSTRSRSIHSADLMVIAGLYLAVIGFFRIAFIVIENNDLLLFGNFAAGLIVGVLGPVYYTVKIRGRGLANLGLSMGAWRTTLGLGLVLAAVQFSITLWGYDLPQAKDWMPLLGMALMVGVFESIFFRGFIQVRLEASFGVVVGVFGAAALYAAYHWAYGMGVTEMSFLFGLGMVYALAFQATKSLLVVWPLLTPLGSFFAQVESGELVGRLPWASLMGFADVLALFGAALWWGHRYERRHAIPLDVQPREESWRSSIPDRTQMTEREGGQNARTRVSRTG